MENELISRNAAIEAVETIGFDFSDSDLSAVELEEVCEAIGEVRQEWLQRIKRLPSAQPEIIRCKDCKHSKHWYLDKFLCFLWHEDGIDVFADGFCNYAERRTDDCV